MQAIDEPLAATETTNVGDPAPVQSVAKLVAAVAKVKKTKAPSSKAKKPSAHPPYAKMIKEAISTLKERTGSSPYAIAKFMEDKHKAHLPFNFRKNLLL
ncbi:hypothetical protein ZIOFF_050925 [Zingiber officinale]|uniref:H15 domain-containing protein n=1 Tax=Zingiber officinale TaxID=94328 RepID=A0A8J5KQP3_ZINOF|nr:hypothetical protein ZIOFF_050925 [Zingiber officinale]